MVKSFARWARKEGISKASLSKAALEIAGGIFEGDLGGHIVKKRVARTGRGKRGGYRTIAAFRASNRAMVFFLEGYAKSKKGNISSRELAAFQLVADSLFRLTEDQIRILKREGVIVEIERTDE